MKKEKSKKIHEKMTREDLLGFSLDVFSLNQAEYVSKKIIDEILFHTFETIRIHNVKQMDIDYSVYRNFINLEMIVNLGLIKSEKEIELIKNNDFIFDVNPCKIDAWASGRAKIITSTQPKEQIIPSVPRPDKNNESSKAKKKDKDKTKLENNTITRNRNIINTKNIIVKEQPPKELPMDDIRPIEEKKETKSFNYDEMKLKGYRAYFQEKQIETLKRKQLEKEQAERAKEEEKKLKQVKDLMNAGKLVSWDANGTFLPIKSLKDTELKNPPQPRQKIMDNKTIYDQDNIFDLDEEGNPKKKKILEISKDKIPTIPKIENYYQPNPLVSHNIQQGVVLEFYGHKKSGGKYDVGGGRLTMEQYHQLLDQINPYENAQIEERADESSEKEVSEKKEEKEEEEVGENGEKKGDKTSSKKKKGMSGSKKLYFLFRDEIKAVEDHKKKKKNQENIIKKKKKPEEKKSKAQIDKIELKNFNFKEIKNTQDKTIYNELKEKLDEGYQDYYNEKKNLIRMPADLHLKDEINRRTREKRIIIDGSSTINQQLPNTIRRTLTKIKEEIDQNEEIRKTKTVLPPIMSARPKSSYITNKNKNKKKEIETEKQ